jgi:glycosyltransferase involved in cell wall biosynthesis
VHDIIAHIKASDLVISPVTSGSGTRMKILESIACGKPVISTAFGAEGLNLELMDNQLFIATNWDQFAQKIALQTSKSGGILLNDAFKKEYGWSNIVARISLNKPNT